MIKVVENAAEKGMITLVEPPIVLTVRATYDGKTVEISKFDDYVERTIAIPDGVVPNKMTTGIVVEPDGTVRHVPTQFLLIVVYTHSTHVECSVPDIAIVWFFIDSKCRYGSAKKRWLGNSQTA